jgi:hypothetical protein
MSRLLNVTTVLEQNQTSYSNYVSKFLYTIIVNLITTESIKLFLHIKIKKF